MFDRRRFGGLVAGTLAWPPMARAQDRTLPFYASVGPDLIRYDLDVAAATLTPRSTVTLPSNIQYAWPDPKKRFLYVAASNNRPGGPEAGGHCVAVMRIAEDGTLTPHGPAVPLRQRPVHASLDGDGRFLLTAYNIPSNVSVHRIRQDGSIGEEVVQRQTLDTGIYAHQIRTTPANKTVALVTRGNDARPGQAEDPGAIKIFAFQDGQLSNLQSLAPNNNGIGFGPRHLDFDASGRFAAVSLERQNSLCIYRLLPDGRFSDEPLFIRNALLDEDAKAKHPGQGAGPIHFHPAGYFVYQTNRGSGTVDDKGQAVSNGGENNVVVWSINPTTGAPSRIQNIDSHGFELRTFAIDPGGRLLVAASQTAMAVRDGDRITHVSAGLSLYRIGTDGKLTFVRKHDVDTGAGAQFWSGLLNMP